MFCRGMMGYICVLTSDHQPNARAFCVEDSICRNDEFPCSDGSGCFPSNSFCNGQIECADGSDEIWRNVTNKKQANATFCLRYNRRICVLPDEALHNKKIFCSEVRSCLEDEMSCDDGSRCYQPYQFCDRNGADCSDKSDALQRNNHIEYQSDYTFCRGETGYICPIRKDLLPKVERFCDKEWECKDNEFECADGSMCLSAKDFCTDFPKCIDESDGMIRDRTKKYHAEMTFVPATGDRICIVPAEKVMLWEDKCENKTTECQCRRRGKHYMDDECFRCLSLPNFALSTVHLCDGVVDCPDLSDECLCPIKTRLNICRKLTLGKIISQQEHGPAIICTAKNATTEIFATKEIICDGRTDCLDDEDELGCDRNESNVIETRKEKKYKCPNEDKYVTKCDGVPECLLFMQEECNCPKKADFCKHLISHFNIHDTKCKTDASASDRIFNTHVCNGVADCVNSEDERGCSAMRFYCTDAPTPSVPLANRCDRHDDCENEADEKGCPHFYCNDNGIVKYLQLRYKCDGFQDCWSWRDECDCVTSAFSDDTSMITNKVVLAIVWIMSLVAVTGCVGVVAVTLRDMRRSINTGSKSMSQHAKLMKIMILSLSLSDLLVAVYTLVICVKAVEFNTDYCKVDLEWRSSVTCSIVGALLVIGSEQSVFTMVVIAVFRLISVKRPFAPPNIRGAVMILSTTWLLSVLSGVIPMIRRAEDYFVKSILFNQNSLFKIVHQNDTQYLFNWLGLMRHDPSNESNYGGTDWSNFKNRAVEVNPNLTIVYEYGYYSSHTVCLPTLFPDRCHDLAWGYTLFLLIMNFLAFVFMIIIYFALYKHTVMTKPGEQSHAFNDKRRSRNSKMQRKLTRIVFSDFLCWMPLCYAFDKHFDRR